MTPESHPSAAAPRRPLERADDPGTPRPVPARPAFPPAPGDSRAPLEPSIEPADPRPAAGEGSGIAARSGSAAVPVSALGEIARAFQANADALREVNAVQGEIARTIRRTDRAEAIIASTNALNDTFRGLTSIQREILERLDDTRKRPNRLVPMLLLGLLVVFVGGIAAVVHLIDLSRAERPDAVAIGREMEAARDRGRAEAGAEKDKEIVRAERDAEELRTRLDALEARYEEKQRLLDDALTEKRSIEAEQQVLADQLLGLRNESAARKVLEDEMREAAAKLAVLEPRVTQLQADLDKEKADKARLAERLGAARLGLPVDEPAAKPPEEAKPALAAPRAVSRDPRQIEAVLSLMNRFLEATAGATEYWQVRKVDGISADRLHGVVAYRYDPRGKLLDGVEADELVIWLDRDQRRVEFEFRGGSKVFDKAKTPFHDGSYTLPVAQGDDLLRLWSQSGMLFLRNR